MGNEIIKGWVIETAKTEGSGITPCLVNRQLSLAIRIPNESLKIFGFYCAGPQLGIIGHESKGTKEEQANEALYIISKELKNSENRIDYHDIKKYLKEYKGEYRLSKLIPASKVTLDSLKRTITVMDEGYQDLCKMAGLRHQNDFNSFIK